MISEIDLGAWSDWVFEDFIIEEKNVTGTFRFKLMELSTEAKEFRLYRSQIMPTTGFSEPDSIGKELVDKIGPYQEHVSEYSSILGWTDYETVLEEADYQAQWFADAALYLSEEKKITSQFDLNSEEHPATFSPTMIEKFINFSACIIIQKWNKKNFYSV